MARIRTIKPEFWTSEQVMECSTTARLLFIGMWNFCDDAGIHVASAKTLKAEVFPGDEIPIAEVAAYVNELLKAGLLEQYESAGKQYWCVTGWNHQKIEKPSYKHPKPTEIQQPVTEDSPTDRRKLADHSPPEGKGEEGKGEEGKETLSSSPPLAATATCPPCPIAEIIEVYHSALPELPRMIVRNETRDGYIRQRWRDFYDQGDSADKAGGLECFRWYFGQKVKQSKFLTGRSKANGSNKPFLADLEWLTKPTNFAKVIEGRYDERAA